MSTKCSIKWSKEDTGKPGYHLYTDVFDTYDTDEPTVYLELVGVSVELSTMENGAAVTVAIPHNIAVALGLIGASSTPSA